jgi:hypothetical protein
VFITNKQTNKHFLKRIVEVLFSRLARRKSLVTGFSYSIDDISVIDEIDKIAKEDGVSFSQVVMQQLKELVHQKKAFEAAAKGENISSVSILGYNVIQSGEQYQEQQQQQHKSNLLVKTLDSWIDNNIVGQRDWEPALAEVDNVPLLERYASLGRNITTAANRQVSQLRVARSRKGVSR